MRSAYLCLLSLMLLAAALLGGEDHAWEGERASLQPATVVWAGGCETLADFDESLALLEDADLEARFYEPPVTNDDRTEMFLAPQPVIVEVARIFPPEPASLIAPRDPALRLPQRPPRTVLAA